MKTIKVSETTRIQLDWLVAKCERIELFPWPNGTLNIYRPVTDDYAVWEPHCRWEQSGPIIEREKISIETWNDDIPGLEWAASCEVTTDQYGETSRRDYNGPTPLIAAMRCYVASKMGDVVEVPEELT